jgi:hypothetical protein
MAQACVNYGTAAALKAGEVPLRLDERFLHQVRGAPFGPQV